MKQVARHPDASRDANRQLMVGAAVAAEDPDAWERAEAWERRHVWRGAGHRRGGGGCGLLGAGGRHQAGGQEAQKVQVFQGWSS